MAEEKIDLRTEREKLHDEQTAIIAKRYKELIPYAPYPTRAMTFIGAEIGLSEQSVRNRLIELGLYTPQGRKGRSGRKHVL